MRPNMNEPWIVIIHPYSLNSQIGPKRDLSGPRWDEDGWYSIAWFPNYNAMDSRREYIDECIETEREELRALRRHINERA